MTKFVFVAVAMAQFAWSAASAAEPVRNARPVAASPFMNVYGSAAPPFGFVQFCDRMSAECAPHGGSSARFDASPRRLSELDETNRRINQDIIPATDQEIYGVQEYWTLPTTTGDCEDYALLKRNVLIKQGWPPSALLLTVVRDEIGDGHAVLTVRTAQGDFVLDNKVNDVKLWHQTGYRFVMRQSFVDPRLWMSLVPDNQDRSGTLTSQPARRR